MTRKEIKAANDSLPRPFFKNWTEEQDRLYEELSCREMVNSCLCYGTLHNFWGENSYGVNYSADYIRKLGVERVKEIVREQEADFARAVVLRNVFTDSEGLSYNSIVWADEQ